jgi:hypothetical protein
VRRLEAQGLDREHAIQQTAAAYGLEPRKVHWCAETAPGDPTAPVAFSRRQRGCPGADGRSASRHPDEQPLAA